MSPIYLFLFLISLKLVFYTMSYVLPFPPFSSHLLSSIPLSPSFLLPFHRFFLSYASLCSRREYLMIIFPSLYFFFLTFVIPFICGSFTHSPSPFSSISLSYSSSYLFRCVVSSMEARIVILYANLLPFLSVYSLEPLQKYHLSLEQ